MLQHAIRDGIIVGALEWTKQTCENCSEGCSCIAITGIDLPEGIKPSHTLIPYRKNIDGGDPHLIGYIGVGCGCYAKFHRQLAHIQGRMKK